METREETIARIARSNETITRYAPAYRALERRDFDSVYPLVFGYIRDRFLLTRDMCRSEDIMDLADASLRQLLELRRRGIDAGEIARSCSGASSVIAKKVLLMKAVQDVFSVSMTPQEFAGIDTVSDLARFLCASGGNAVPEAPETPSGSGSADGFDPEHVRGDFPALCPRTVLEAVQRIESCRGNVHRGIHTLSDRCTEVYEQARRTCAAFLGTQPGRLTFTAGTTDGINRVAAAMTGQPGGVAVTALEHHSNFVPWQQLCLREGRPFRVCPVLADGSLDLNALDRMLDGDISLLAITGCSNVRGPFGIGLLYCREPIPPAVFGGGMVDTVTQGHTDFLPTLEAGTPNVSGAAGLAAALEYRSKLPRGWQAHEAALLRRAETLLSELPGVRILGSGPRTGCLSLTLEGPSALEAAALLDQMGIALRSGNHCAQPLHDRLGLSGSVRVSPAFYNTEEELDRLAEALERTLSAAAKAGLRFGGEARG